MQIGQNNHSYGKKGTRNMSSVTNVVRNLNFNPAHFTTRVNGSGIFVDVKASGGGADDPSLWAFGCTLESETVGETTTYSVHIEGGHFAVQGYGDYIHPATDYDLPDISSCSNCYPTVIFDIAAEEASIEILPAYPVQTANSVQIPLVEYNSNVASNSWEVPDGYIYHRGNIDFATSIVFG